MNADASPVDSPNGEPASPFRNYAAATTTNAFNQRSDRPVGPVIQASAHSLYAQQDKETIARKNKFDLQGVKTASLRKTHNSRMSVKSHAITCWTAASKQDLMDGIMQEFNKDLVQYACVASEVGAASSKTHLHIHIVLKQVVNKKDWFMDKYAGVHCNYQVTRSNDAWNEYIKKDGDYLEYGDFHDANARPARFLSTPPTTPSFDAEDASSSSVVPPAKPLTVRAQAAERRQRKVELARTALDMACTSVTKAMQYSNKMVPEEFIFRSDSYHKSFVYVNKAAREEQAAFMEKEFNWPLSFPNCTPQLRDAVQQWMNEQFRNPNRAKCLVLIGPTETGKTSFALSLPGRACYFKGRWSLSTWSDDARYLVFDDIPWDDFEKRNFPDKKDLLSANGLVATTDKYERTITINVAVPAIVLLNPGNDGSLTAPPITADDHHNADYWRERAVVYRMGPDEFFYRPGLPSSSGAACHPFARPLLGHDNEFDDAERVWLAAQERRRLAATTAEKQLTVAESSMSMADPDDANASGDRF